MRRMLAIIVLALLASVPSTVRAQNYSINWYTIGGGGGTSAGGNYSVTGTIGQPATATMSGGTYSLTGGFWSILAVVQVPGSPLLTITRAGSEAIISWPVSSATFNLQVTSSLASGSWANSSLTLTTNNGVVSATVPSITSGYQYYRLEAPQ